MRTFFIVLGIIVGFLIIVGLLSGEEDQKTETYALFYANKAIENQLKSPSTAEFGGVRNSRISKDVDTFYVESFVDSQNGFGATIRSYFKVKVTFVDDKVKTSIIELKQ